MLISASEDAALCGEHKEELDSAEEKRIKCTNCLTSKADFIECKEHTALNEIGKNCESCNNLKKLVNKFQTHKHTFSCQKKNKLITIQESEGHGRNDNIKKGCKISNHVQCRHDFPKFPMNRTRFILGLSKNLPPDEVSHRKKDLKKIKKYLIRQTFIEDESAADLYPSENHFKSLTFIEFLYEVGMFATNKLLKDYTRNEKAVAYERYINALSASVRGSGSIFLKRETKDIQTNNFNRRIMEVHQANHDLQIVVDQVYITNIKK